MGNLSSQSYTYNNSREMMMQNLAVKEWEEHKSFYPGQLTDIDTDDDTDIRSLINFGYLHQRPKDIYTFSPLSLDLLQEYHDKHYAPRNIAHKKTLSDRLILCYAHMMVWFGSWLIRVGG